MFFKEILNGLNNTASRADKWICIYIQIGYALHWLYIPVNSLVVSVDGFQLCTAFMWYEFDSRRLEQLFGTPFSKVSLR